MSPEPPTTADHIEQQESEVARAVQAMRDALDVLATALRRQEQERRKQQKAAASPPASKLGQPSAKGVADPRSHNGPRSRPPPPEFDFEKLPDGQLLTESETAAVGRWSVNTLSSWRQAAGHPLKWQVIGGRRVRYRAGDVRRFIESGYRAQGRPPLGKAAMTGAERSHRHRLKHGSVPRKTAAAPAVKRTPPKPPAEPK